MKKCYFLGLLIFIIIFGVSFFNITRVKATDMTSTTVVSLENPIYLLSDTGEPVKNADGETKIKGETLIPKIIGATIQKILGYVGALTLIVFFYGGFTWLTSAGNAEKVKKGLDAMLYAVIGLFVIFASYAIITVVLKALLS